MICAIDAGVAVKWFAAGDWARREDDIDAALQILQASTNGSFEFFQPSHFLAEVAAVLTRLDPEHALQNAGDLAAMNITWAEPTFACAKAIELARSLNHHLFDITYHALALSLPGAMLVTADRSCFDKARLLGQIAWLPDFPDP